MKAKLRCTGSGGRCEPHLCHLYQHLVDNQFIMDIGSFDADALKIYSGDESVARLIPPAIVEVIKAKKLFGWQKSLTPKG